MDPDLTTSTKVGGEINMYDDVVSNAIAFCSIVMKESRRVNPSHVSRCMVPLIQTLRLNLTRSFVSFIGPAGEGNMYGMQYGYEKSIDYTEAIPSTVCMFGSPRLEFLVPVLASHIIHRMILILPQQEVDTILPKLNKPDILKFVYSFNKQIDLVSDELLYSIDPNSAIYQQCDILHFLPTYTLPTISFQHLTEVLLSSRHVPGTHRIIWMEEEMVNSTETTVTTPHIISYDYLQFFTPILTTTWNYYAGFKEHIDSNGFHAKGYDKCAECSEMLLTIHIGHLLYEDDDEDEDDNDEEVNENKEDNTMNINEIEYYLFHYHSNPYHSNNNNNNNNSAKEYDDDSEYDDNPILISYTIRVFADTAYGLYEALHHSGYQAVYIVHDMTLATWEQLIRHHCIQLTHRSERKQNKKKKATASSWWSNYCHKQRHLTTTATAVVVQHMLQIALGPHDVTTLLPKYIVYHMEQLWSDIAFGQFHSQYDYLLQHAQSIWTFSELHREYLLTVTNTGGLEEVHTMFLFSNHSIIPINAINTNATNTNTTNDENIVKVGFFGSCSTRRIHSLHYIHDILDRYNQALWDSLHANHTINNNNNVFIKFICICGGWKELLFDYDLDAFLQPFDIVINIHNEQVVSSTYKWNSTAKLYAEKLNLFANKTHQQQQNEETETTTSFVTAEDPDQSEITQNGNESMLSENHNKYDGNVLEVHRINYLLQLGKFIISEPGKDETLISQYSPMIKFVKSIDEMMDKVIYYANHETLRKEHIIKQSAIFEDMNHDVRNLRKDLQRVWKKMELDEREE